MNNHSLSTTLITILLSSLIVFAACTEQSKSSSPDITSDQKMLIFTKTEGYRHASIPDGVEAIRQLAADNNRAADHTEDASIFTSDSLDAYQAIIFLNTTGNILNEDQQAAFKSYIQQGGGFVGIHAATDTEYEWPWYGEMVGAYFDSHPQIQQARLEVIDRNHPSTRSLPEEWIRTDEWYNFMDINPAINVLINLDESSYEGGENGENHPAAWYHEFEGGRVFYTAGGHTSESYSSKQFLNHVWGGISYVVENSN